MAIKKENQYDVIITHNDNLISNEDNKVMQFAVTAENEMFAHNAAFEYFRGLSDDDLKSISISKIGEVIVYIAGEPKKKRIRQTDVLALTEKTEEKDDALGR